MKEQHTMCFVSSDGTKIDMDLCCFCTRASNLLQRVDCEYYENSFEGVSCVGVENVSNVLLRNEELLRFAAHEQDMLENKRAFLSTMSADAG